MTRSPLRFSFFVRSLAAATLALGVLGAPSAAAGKSKIVIIKSKNLPPFDQAAREFKLCLAAKHVTASYEEMVLPDDPAQADSMIRIASAAKPDLMLTLGGLASRLAREKSRKTPSVFCMLLNPANNGTEKGGVCLDIRAADYLDYLRRNFPQFKRVGIIYNPVKSKDIVDDFRSLTNPSQSLVYVEINDIGGLEAGLRSLKSRADCLLMVADATLYTPQTASQIILQTIQMNLPFVALSGAFVKAGALAAVYADPADNGCQAADLAARALQGESPLEMPLVYPRKVGSSINLVVADRLHIPVGRETRSAADQIVE